MMGARRLRRPSLTTLLTLLILLVYGWAVLRGIGFFVWHDDEPVLVLTAKAMVEGHALYRDIWFNYPPGYPHYLAGLFGLLGYSVPSARLGSLLAGAVSLLAVTGIARALGSRGSGVAAMLLLGTAPHFIVLSTAALAEGPTFALVTLSVYTAVRYLEQGGARWLAVCGVALGLAVSFKPTALVAVVVPLVAWLGVQKRRLGKRPQTSHLEGHEPSQSRVWGLPWGVGLRELTLLACCSGLPLAILVLANHPADFARQFLVTWQNSRGAFVYEPLTNLGQIGGYFWADKYGLSHVSLLALAIVGWVGLRRRRAPFAWLALSWVGGVILGLALHTPLYRHHLLALLYPMCVLAGLGVGELISGLSEATRARQWLTCLVVIWAALEARDALWASLTAVQRVEADQLEISEAAVAELHEVTAPGDYVLTDAPILAIRAERLVPVETINTSRMRIRTGQLTVDDLVAVIRRDAPTAIVFWENKLDAVPGFGEWVAKRYDLLQDWDGRHRMYVPQGMPRER